MPELKTDIIESVLEPLVDKHGLAHVVVGLALLAYEKAEHVRINWDDECLAISWERDGRKLETVARRIKQ